MFESRSGNWPCHMIHCKYTNLIGGWWTKNITYRKGTCGEQKNIAYNLLLLSLIKVRVRGDRICSHDSNYMHILILTKMELEEYNTEWANCLFYTPGLTSGLKGSMNVNRGALLLVPQLQCISFFVFYINSKLSVL